MISRRALFAGAGATAVAAALPRETRKLNEIRFTTGSREVFRFDASGRTGIGVTAPSKPLEIRFT